MQNNRLEPQNYNLSFIERIEMALFCPKTAQKLQLCNFDIVPVCTYKESGASSWKY